MLGMVFTELMDMVEERWSLDVVDATLDSAGLTGSYTSVGEYDDDEMTRIVVALSETTGVPVPDLLHAYGRHLFGRFVATHGFLLGDDADMYTFLAGLETHVHTEVRKLYEHAKPPLFTSTWADDGAFEVRYRSERGLGRFALGLLESCAEHYQQPVRIDADDLSGGAQSDVVFRITRVDPPDAV